MRWRWRSKRTKSRAVSVQRDASDVVVVLADDRMLRVPLAWLPGLGTDASSIRISNDGTSLLGSGIQTIEIAALVASPPLDELEREMQWFFDHPREGWILVPLRPTRALSLAETKFGGNPFVDGRGERPICPGCRAPLGFVLQLERARFPGMWFPAGTDLFQVFRCLRGCEMESLASSDVPMASRFVAVSGADGPDPARDRTELRTASCDALPERELAVTRILDYPSSYEGREDWWGERWERFQEKWMPQFEHDEWFLGGVHWNRIPNHEGIKVMGLPSWTQSGYPPTCVCGRKKAFFFQLASIWKEDVDLSIGDAGNVYHFVCETCGERSIETSWDCS